MYKIKLDKQPRKRREAIVNLNSCLSNPGRFSILLLGGRGTGKTFWVEQFAKENKYLLNIVRARLTEPTTKYWEKLFEDTNGGILLLKDVEYLSKENQEVLFEGLSTTNGCFGFSKKTYEVRIVFTSSAPVTQLRDSKRYLSDYFFDRIAQLVVELPNFANCSNKIGVDFKNTWEKFQFTSAYPEELEPWLKEHAHTLNGNFRDLDKLCINWDNLYRKEKATLEELSIESIRKIKNEVIESFKAYNHFPESKETGVYELYFEDNSYQDLLDGFKFKLKTWAKEKYGSLRKAGKALNISPRTMERW